MEFLLSAVFVIIPATGLYLWYRVMVIGPVNKEQQQGQNNATDTATTKADYPDFTENF